MIVNSSHASQDDRAPSGSGERLSEVVVTALLVERTARMPDYRKESESLRELAACMSMSPSGLLQRLTEVALEVTGAQSAGISMIETAADASELFRWRAACGEFAKYLGRATPRHASPCGYVLATNQTQLMREPMRSYPHLAEMSPAVAEVLLMPFYREGVATGTLWVVAHTADKHFDSEDARLLSSISQFCSAAVLAAEDREEIAEAHRESSAQSELWETTLACIGDAVISTDVEQCITFFNPMAETLTGWTREQAIGMPVKRVIDIVDATTRQALASPVHKALTTGAVATLGSDALLRARDGSEYAVADCSAPIHSRAGKLIGAVLVFRDITEQRKHEAQSRTTYDRLQLLLGHSRDFAVVMTNPVGTVLDWMGAAERIFGWSAADIVGESLAAIFTPEDRAAKAPQKEMQVAAETGRAEDKRWHQRKDGSRVFVDGVMMAMRAADGSLLGFGKVLRDTTARHRDQEEINRNREFMHRLVDSSPDCIKVLDVDGRLQSINETGLKIMEISDFERCRHADWEAFWQGEERQAAHRAVQAAREGRASGFSGFGPTMAGTPKWWDVQVAPILGTDHFPEKILVVLRDITASKLAEQNLLHLVDVQRRHTQRLSKLAAASRAITASLHVDSIAHAVVHDARAIIGAHQSVITLTAREGIDADAPRVPRVASSSPAFAFSFSEKCAGLRSGLCELSWAAIHQEICGTHSPLRLTREELARRHLPTRGGVAPLGGLLAVPLLAPGRRVLGVLHFSDKEEGEFTEEDEAIALQLAAVVAAGLQNATLYERLRDQDQRKDGFLATLAHELRNPLAPIRTGLEVMKLANSKETRFRAREMIERQVSQLVRLVDDLLDVARVNQGKLTLVQARVSASDIVENAIETSSPLIEAAQHTLELRLPQTPVFVYVDAIRIAQVISNLLNNAAKYTPAGGHIVVSVKRSEEEAVFVVSDNGIGIPAALLPKVFDLFSQVSRSLARSQGGLGIGLSLVKNLVTMHGGTIEAHSAGLGLGSSFVVRLPLAQGAEELPQPGASSDAEGVSEPDRPLRVLIADDNVDAAQTLGMLIDLYGHDRLIVHNGPDAVQACRTYLPQLVFLDIGLPGINGYEVARRVRAADEFGRPMLVALTGWGTEHDRQRSLEAGIDLHLTKPVEPDAVAQVLHSVS